MKLYKQGEKLYTHAEVVISDKRQRRRVFMLHVQHKDEPI